jgi:adenylate cyclase class IV
MPREYEYRYKNFNKKDILKKFKNLGAIKNGHYIFRVQVFMHSNKNINTYIRVRDEGHRITMTTKIKTNNEFVEENEVIVNDFDEACSILLNVGCKKKYYFEKIREIWILNNIEICFDTNPGRPLDLMEIETNSKKELLKIINQLDLKDVSHDDFIEMDLYKDEFGIISIPKDIDLTFLNVKKELGKIVTKNKSKFNNLVKEQKKLYLSLIKK